MTKTSRTIITIVLVTGVLVGALAATAYAFRTRLAEMAIVAAVFDRLGWRMDRDPADTAYWSCPMHPDVHEHGPGACPSVA